MALQSANFNVVEDSGIGIPNQDYNPTDFLNTTVANIIADIIIDIDPFIYYEDEVIIDFPVYYEEIIHHTTPHYHAVESVAYDGSSIVMQDGSKWEVSFWQQGAVKYWAAGTQLEITQNNSIFYEGQFCIQNKSTSQWAGADLIRGPEVGGVDTYEIMVIDEIRGNVCLMNGLGEESVWQVHADDCHHLQHWNLLEGIIVGKDWEWFSGTNSILIDSEQKCYVRASKI